MISPTRPRGERNHRPRRGERSTVLGRAGEGSLPSGGSRSTSVGQPPQSLPFSRRTSTGGPPILSFQYVPRISRHGRIRGPPGRPLSPHRDRGLTPDTRYLTPYFRHPLFSSTSPDAPSFLEVEESGVRSQESESCCGPPCFWASGSGTRNSDAFPASRFSRSFVFINISGCTFIFERQESESARHMSRIPSPVFPIVCFHIHSGLERRFLSSAWAFRLRTPDAELRTVLSVVLGCPRSARRVRAQAFRPDIARSCLSSSKLA